MIARCQAQGEYRTASAVAGQLVNLLRQAGQLDEALRWAEKTIELTGQARLGPWTQLLAECQRLQVLNAMGRWRDVLDAVQGHRKQLNDLPEKSDADETAIPWNVREVLLDTGRSAAVGLKEWQTALKLNAEVGQSQRRRGAGELEIASTRFNDHWPLLRLGRFEEARPLLEACREVYEQHQHLPHLGGVYGALADLEDEQGHGDAAIRFEKSALKYAYRAAKPEDCATSHNNLSNYLGRAGQPAEAWLPHRLAAALIFCQMGSGHFASVVGNVARSNLPAARPSSEEVADAVQHIEGVRFRALFDRLPKRYADGDAALAALWEMVKQEQRKLKLREWSRLLKGIAAVARGEGGPELRHKIEGLLPKLEEQGWRIAQAVHRIWDGERDPDALTAGLDDNSAQLVRQILKLIEPPG